jgi:hypothetical protein
MHRWSTRSYNTFCSTPICQPYVQEHLPHAALQHSHLLNAIFATAALDLAISSSPQQGSRARYYLRAALECITVANADFRSHVTSISPENIDLLMYFSSMAAILQFSMPSDEITITPTGTIDRVATLYDMWLGSMRIGMSNLDWLMASPCPAAAVAESYGTDPELMKALDPGTQAAINLLSSVSRRVRLPHITTATTAATAVGNAVPPDAYPQHDRAGIGEIDTATAMATPGTDTYTQMTIRTTHNPSTSTTQPASPATPLDAKGPLAHSVFSYQLAVGQTKYCFAEDHRNRAQSYFLTLFPVAGEEFAAAVRSREPMAMFVLMYWGVLIHRASRDPRTWTIRSSGRDLVAEVSQLLLTSCIVDIPGVREGIAWTRFQVDLGPLEGCELDLGMVGGYVESSEHD